MHSRSVCALKLTLAIHLSHYRCRQRLITHTQANVHTLEYHTYAITQFILHTKTTNNAITQVAIIKRHLNVKSHTHAHLVHWQPFLVLMDSFTARTFIYECTLYTLC